MKEKITTAAKVLVVVSALVLSLPVLAQVTPPAGGAPTCPSGHPGCDAPINVSNTAQIKLGKLTLGNACIPGGPCTSIIPQMLTVNGKATVTSVLDVTGFVNWGSTILSSGVLGGTLQITGAALPGTLWPSGTPFPPGVPAVGRVLTSDASGYATWQDPSSSSSTSQWIVSGANMRNANTGNVLVSGQLPNTPVDAGVNLGIDTAGYAGMQLNAGSSAGGYIDFAETGTDFGGRIIYKNGSRAMSLYANGFEGLKVNSSGSVEIPRTLDIGVTPGTPIRDSSRTSLLVRGGGIVSNDAPNSFRWNGLGPLGSDPRPGIDYSIKADSIATNVVRANKYDVPGGAIPVYKPATFCDTQGVVLWQDSCYSSGGGPFHAGSGWFGGNILFGYILPASVIL